MRKTWKKRIQAGWTAPVRTASVLLGLFLLVAGWLPGSVPAVYAADAYLDVQPQTAEVGNDIAVTIVLQGDNIGRARVMVSYDKEVLCYQGDEGDSGMIDLTIAGTGDGITYTLPFKAVGAGSSALTMTPMSAYDMDEMSMPLPEEQTVSVTVTAPPETAPSGQKEEVDPDTDPVKKDPQEQQPDKQEQEEAAPDAEPHPAATVPVLLALAAVILVILAVVLVRRRRR